MIDRVPTYPGRIHLTPVPAEENTFDLTMADGASVAGTPINKATLLPDRAVYAVWPAGGPEEDPTPADAFAALGGRTWQLIASYSAAGAHSFTVPDLFFGEDYELGILLLGGGGSGMARGRAGNTDRDVAKGGASGELVLRVLKTGTDLDIEEEISVTVGAGGSAVTAAHNGSENGNDGGASTFGSLITAQGGSGGIVSFMVNYSGGQCPDRIANFSPFGGVPVIDIQDEDEGYLSIFPRSPNAVNRFDVADLHVYCGAGGSYQQTSVERVKGHSGAAAYDASSSTVTGGDATAPGDGGGAATNTGTGSAKSGKGAPGLCLIYARKAG